MDLITKCPLERLPGFLHSCIDEELGVLKAENNKFTNYWSLEDWLAVKSATKNIFKTAMKESWNTEQFISDLKEIPTAHRNAFTDALEIRRNDLRSKLLYDINNVGTPALKDFDWEVKLSLASDKLASMYEPLLGLDLDVQNSSGSTKKLSLELNKAELNHILASLESVHKTLLKIKA